MVNDHFVLASQEVRHGLKLNYSLTFLIFTEFRFSRLSDQLEQSGVYFFVGVEFEI